MSDLLSDFDSVKAQEPAQAASQANLLDEFDSISQPKARAELAAKGPAPDMGNLKAFGANAGHAMGSGVLALQQWLGKGLKAATPDSWNATQDAGDWLINNATQGARKLNAEVDPYRAGNPLSSLSGEFFGAVTSPLNKLVPGSGMGSTLAGTALKSGAQGAALSALLTPVTDENNSFGYEKIKQAAQGAVGGAIGGVAFSGLRSGASWVIDKAKSLFAKTGDASQAAESAVNLALQQAKVEPSAITPELRQGLKAQVQGALQTGEKIDPDALVRVAKAHALPVPVELTAGQASRDPFKYALEQNLAKDPAAGVSLVERFNAQNAAFKQNLDALGASSGTDLVTGGQSLTQSLKDINEHLAGKVTDAYKAFKAATGRDLDVPLQGLAQDYAKIKSDFEDAIPTAIRNKFEGLGLLSGKQNKTFSIGDAEDLIKTINAHYNPAEGKSASNTALGNLRSAVQNAIADGTTDSALGAGAADLAKQARATAKARFDLINASPALDAAISGKANDEAVKKFILGGKPTDVARTMDLLRKYNPEAAENVAGTVMAHIKNQVLNRASEADTNGIVSNDKLRAFTNDPFNAVRLKAVIGEDKFGALKRLQETVENANMVPNKSGVNFSNTAVTAKQFVDRAAQGGAVPGALEMVAHGRIPVVSPLASVIAQSSRANALGPYVERALNPVRSSTWSPEESAAMSRLADVLGRATVRGSAAATPEAVRMRNQ